MRSQSHRSLPRLGSALRVPNGTSGDENRTRTVSLGSCAAPGASVQSELQGGRSV